MRSRSVGLITEDPALYADLAAALRERRIPTASLLPGDRIPNRVAVVLTSRAEAPGISHPRVLAVAPDSPRAALWAAVESALQSADGLAPPTELLLGVDPGPRPGVAVLSGGRLLTEGVLDSPSTVGTWASELAERFPGRALRIRVGSGDPPSRNRIVSALHGRGMPVELVDERSTTPRIARRLRDTAAARAIARLPGRPIDGVSPVRPTLGALTRIQHLSREGSGGRFTISRAVARRVLDGELSLDEAVRLGGRREPTSPETPAARDRGAKSDITEGVGRPWSHRSSG